MNKAKELRKLILEMIYIAQSGHPGGSLSLVEILLALFGQEEKIFNLNQDRFVLSKGHGVPAVYALLFQLNLIQKEELLTFRKLGSRLQGHPDVQRIPFLESSTGSLGQGASVALGLAIAQPYSHIYCICGDGELQEGQIWEMALYAGFKKVKNFTLLVDYNKIQLDGYVKDILDLEPLADKWKAFRWEVHEVDGHKIDELQSVLKKKQEGPRILICHTVKGKGVSFMENNPSWHGKAPKKEEYELALKELS